MIKYIGSFIKRKGHLVFGSSIISKTFSFLISIFVIRYISKTEFGYVTYAKTILFFLSPFLGLGLNNSLLRYGSILNKQYEKKDYYLYSLKYGLLFSVILVVGLLLFSPVITANITGANIYLEILALSIISLTLYSVFLSYLRINNLNKAFSVVNVYFSTVSFVIAFILTYFFKGIGFVISTALSPLLVFSIFYGKRFISELKDILSIHFNWKLKKEFINYGLLIGVGSIASQITLMTDNILIGNIVKDPNLLAVYRTGSLIPFNLFFIPSVFLTTDFVKIASETSNTGFLKNYYVNYLKVFGIISFFLIGGIYLFAHEVVQIIFSSKYAASADILKILLIGMVGAFLLRIPLGNILNAVGKAKWNTYNAYFMLVFNGIMTYFLILRYGIIGAAYATSIMLWVSGLISLGLFVFYLRKCNVNLK